MTNQSQQSCPIQHDYYPEDEINLIDYLRVLCKWKWLIIVGTLLCAVAAAVISLWMPKVYEITLSIEPGTINVGNDGRLIYLDTVNNICRKINEGIYDKRMVKLLNIDPLKTGFRFKANVKKGEQGNLIKISSEWAEKDVDLGLKAACELPVFLAGDYEKIIKQRKGSYDGRIIMKQNEMEKAETRRSMQQANLKNLKQKKNKLLGTINEVRENAERIVHHRDLLLKNKSGRDDMTLLLYSTILQQNVSYSNQLSNELYSLNTIEEEIKSKIEEFPEDMADIRAELKILTLEKNLIGNIKVIQEPEVSLYHIKPKKKQIVLLSVVVGLFAMIFLVFFIEYIKNASESSPASKKT